MTRGGKREGAGRPEKPDHEIAKNRTIKLSDEDYSTLKEAGMNWLREKLNGYRIAKL
jgi:hypothetical protein